MEDIKISKHRCIIFITVSNQRTKTLVFINYILVHYILIILSNAMGVKLTSWRAPLSVVFCGFLSINSQSSTLGTKCFFSQSVREMNGAETLPADSAAV